MEIYQIISKDALRTELINYTKQCNREAWPILAKKMKENKFLDWEKIFVITENNSIVWYCTFTKEDGIPNRNYSPFVWFVFIDEKYRGKRYSEKLINEVEKYAKTLNFEKLYIVSDHKWLYEKYWFEKMWWNDRWKWTKRKCFCKMIILIKKIIWEIVIFNL